MKREHRVILAIVLVIVGAIFRYFDQILPGSILYLVAWGIAGFEVFQQALVNVKNRFLIAEHFLMSVASIGAVFLGEYFEAAMVMILYQIGEIFEAKAVYRSQESVASLMNLSAPVAYRLEGERRIEIDPSEIKVGDLLDIRAGEKIPVDGIVVRGESTLDQSALTGESQPVFVTQGDEILSGAINGEGWILLKATKSEEQSTAAKIMELLEEATENEAVAESFITRFSKIYTPIVVFLAILITVIPPFLFPGVPFRSWLYRGLSFLVISCPCAFVISVPMSFVAGIGTASRYGILLKGGNIIERLAKIKTMGFDKTGTLTYGDFRVIDADIQGEREEVLSLVIGMEQGSNHPIAKALRNFAGEIEGVALDHITTLSGRGIMGKKEDMTAILGNAALMREEGITLTGEEDGIYLATTAPSKELLASFTLADAPRKEAQKTLEKLKDQGIRDLVMLTGDRNKQAMQIAQTLGITDYHAQLLPQDKLRIVQKLQKEANTAFVGDGLNDAPVLKSAHVGITMGGIGSDASIEAGDIVLLKDDLTGVSHALSISNKTMEVAIQNIFFSIGIKVLFLILSAFGLMPMMLAVFADVGVTLLAVLNCFRIFNMRFDEGSFA